ncbi:NACHT domain-containing protein [Streptomyces monticola]|uniref:NACHT domain-containing protein n=1 Tax=Streptomyces monticola TaxID=2666263 RepID=A0ABW2JMM7_9ACTN
MQGWDVALAKLAGSVVSSVARSLVAPRPGAGLVRDPVRRPPRPRRSPQAAEVMAGRLAERLTGRLSSAYPDLPEHERLAAVESVRDAFAAAGTLDAARVFAADLDPVRLRAELGAPDAGLSERARDLHEELLLLCCEHAVEQITADPSFGSRAAVEQTRRLGRTEDLVRGLAAGPRPAAVELAFEHRYAEFVAETYGRLELFGLTLGQSAREWSLETAYISLSVSGDGTRQGGFGMPGPEQTAAKVEQVLAGADRVVLRGPAGSGKSTLMQWLALNTARRSFTGDLEDWNRCVPFVLRLRAFTASGTLPTPDEFLRAAGVPLHATAPAGWVEGLLGDGRALVLVDGVDEIPTRLRHRTKTWLKSLIAAFPDARYVVTTRPSAVPDEWLARQGFTPHSLLPMERNDIRAFIGHWHDAGRGECRTDAERALLYTYETSLRHAVSTRRDLARLATNPLMCALLCALNRDRRMQLPRARKELYDAALDMLLVRRDTEREISCIEGVDLTREEQTVLLQKLAYWLIRNDQLEAERADVVAMVSEWLAAMPQVQGTAEQVFAHLLIRSGLLREPAPGTVDFVHRTFRDYLGAKAAVEERDFGQLVKNAHDDQWDDVVQMAVGHARPEERARLVKQLLRRAERAPRLRHRLVLLAAACLEHAPELDPEVRRSVEERTRELLPPRDDSHAEELAKVGELALELLAGLAEPDELEEAEAAAVVRTAGLVKGDAALGLISRFAGDVRSRVAWHVSNAWGGFETETYAREILAENPWDTAALQAQTPEQLAALRYVPHARRLHTTGSYADLTPVLALKDLDWLFLLDNRAVTDLSPLMSLPGLTYVGLSNCPELRDLSPLAGPSLNSLSLLELHHDLDLEPLRDMPDLHTLILAYPVLMEGITELPVGDQLRTLNLHRQTRYLDLAGIDRWPRLRTLTVAGMTQLKQLAEMAWPLSELIHLGLHELEHLDLALLHGIPQLASLLLWRCELPNGLGALRELPNLRHLELAQCTGPVDLTPLDEMEGLTVRVT